MQPPAETRFTRFSDAGANIGRWPPDSLHMGPRAAQRRGGRATVRGAAFGALLLGARCDAPGEGPKADRGYRRAAPVIAALAHFHADQGQYPDSLPQLVPAYLAAAALAVPDAPQEHYPLGYRRATDQYALSFRYAGPGMNECTYHSAAAAWGCRGYF